MSSYITGSPGVFIHEEDQATFVNPANITTGAIVGNFKWGKCEEPVLITDTDELINYFGYPDDNNYKDWFCARNFLQYSAALQVIRVVPENANNATNTNIIHDYTSTDISEDVYITAKNFSDFNSIAFSNYISTGKVLGEFSNTNVMYTLLQKQWATGDLVYILHDNPTEYQNKNKDASGNTIGEGSIVYYKNNGTTEVNHWHKAVMNVTPTVSDMATLRATSGLVANTIFIVSSPTGSDKDTYNTAITANDWVVYEGIIGTTPSFLKVTPVVIDQQTITNPALNGGVDTFFKLTYTPAVGDVWKITNGTYTSNQNTINCQDEYNTIVAANDFITYAHNSVTSQNKWKKITLGDPIKIVAKFPGEKGNNISVVISDNTVIEKGTSSTNKIVYEGYNTKLLNDDELCVAVYVDGKLKEFNTYSVNPNATDKNGKTNYIISAVNENSNYIYLVGSNLLEVETPDSNGCYTYQETNGSNQTVNVTYCFAEPTTSTDGKIKFCKKTTSGQTVTYTEVAPNKFFYDLEHQIVYKTIDIHDANNPLKALSLVNGSDGGALTDGDYIKAWEILSDTETYDVSLLMQGGASVNVGKTIISIAEQRQDAIALVSPQYSTITNSRTASDTNSGINDRILDSLIQSATQYGYSSYEFMDGNFKYQYDPYNDCYRWIPLNGDIAGVIAKNDTDKAPWYSPGGKGIKDCTKLFFYPNKAQRDKMYKYRINPVLSFSDTGTILYGDWTGADSNTSFNYVNVRRCFLYMEKTIAGYARDLLWQNNDELLRTSFIQTVDPFLRNIKGDRGISDYKIICNDKLNTEPGVFIAKIYIKPIYSVRWVDITFISSRNDVSFEELAETE